MENMNCIHASNIKKDIGDNLKRVDKPIITSTDEKTKDILSDRGDPDSNIQKDKLSKSTNEKVDVRRNLMKADITVPKRNTVSEHLNQMLIEKKRIREKYTIKLKSKNMNAKCNVKDSQMELSNNSNQHNDGDKIVSNDNNSTETSLPDAKEIKRKSPVIKTITSKNDAIKIYKAVTFTEPKKCTPLKIKIPIDISRKTTKLVKNQNSASKSSVKRNKIERYKRRTSPMSLDRESGSPATEVAKWTPNCVYQHIRPYHEAWVNTTLTAMSRNKRKELNIQNENIIKTFHRLLDKRPESPDLIYENYLDERYTGKIKINHR